MNKSPRGLSYEQERRMGWVLCILCFGASLFVGYWALTPPESAYNWACVRFLLGMAGYIGFAMLGFLILILLKED